MNFSSSLSALLALTQKSIEVHLHSFAYAMVLTREGYFSCVNLSRTQYLDT